MQRNLKRQQLTLNDSVKQVTLYMPSVHLQGNQLRYFIYVNRNISYFYMVCSNSSIQKNKTYNDF